MWPMEKASGSRRLTVHYPGLKKVVGPRASAAHLMISTVQKPPKSKKLVLSDWSLQMIFFLNSDLRKEPITVCLHVERLPIYILSYHITSGLVEFINFYHHLV